MPTAGPVNGCMPERDKVPNVWLWLNRRNNRDKKEDLF